MALLATIPTGALKSRTEFQTDAEYQAYYMRLRRDRGLDDLADGRDYTINLATGEVNTNHD